MAKPPTKQPKKAENLFEIPISSLMPVVVKTDKTIDKDEELEGEVVTEMLAQITDDINDINSIKQILPDVEHIKQLRVSTILSPKDQIDPPLVLTVDDDVYDGRFKVETLNLLTQHFVKHVKLESNMSKIAGEALMDRGSFIYLMLPPSTIDLLIGKQYTLTHEGYDSLKTEKLYGLVGNNAEKLNNFGVEITDDPIVLKKELIEQAKEEGKLAELTFEAYGMSPFKNKSTQVTVSDFKTQAADLRKAAHPILYKVPADSVFPMHEPGDETAHVRYVIAIDPENGGFLSNIVKEDYMAEMEARLSKAMEDKKSQPYKVVSDFDPGFDKETKNKTAKFLRSYYASIEKEIHTALKGGVGGRRLQVEKNEPIYRLVLSRHLANLKTKFLVVPAEYVAYFAFNYNALGVGESLIERTKFYANLRAVVALAKIKGAVTNSIPSQLMTITLDPKERDPIGIVSKVAFNYGKLDVARFPIGTFNPNSIFNALNRAGIRMKVEGGEMMPNTSIDMTDTSRQVVLPDQELEDNLKKMHYLGMQTTPELVDQTLQGDFATGIVLNFGLFIKSCMMDQSKFKQDMASFIQKYIKLDNPLLEIITKDIGEANVETFIASLGISLPSPDTTIIEKQAEAYRTRSDFIDEVMEAIYTDEILEGIYGEGYHPGAARGLRLAIAGQYKRAWLKRENILPEIWESLSEDDEVNKFGDEVVGHHMNVLKINEKILKVLRQAYDNSEKDLAKVLTPPEETATPVTEEGAVEGEEDLLTDDTGDGLGAEAEGEEDLGAEAEGEEETPLEDDTDALDEETV